MTEARLKDTFGNVENLLAQSMKANPDVDKRIRPYFVQLKSTSTDYLAHVRKHFTTSDAITVTAPEAAQAAQMKRNRAYEQSQAKTLEELVELAKAKRYKNPHAWARHILHGRLAKQGARA